MLCIDFFVDKQMNRSHLLELFVVLLMFILYQECEFHVVMMYCYNTIFSLLMQADGCVQENSHDDTLLCLPTLYLYLRPK